jgi:hypothetical protein
MVREWVNFLAMIRPPRGNRVNSMPLVFCGPLRTVDNNHFYRAFRRFQPQRASAIVL